jgi:hypothetical protein
MEESVLDPSAGVVPSGVEIISVSGAQELSMVPMVVTHVLRSKISDAPEGLGAVAPRLVAAEVKETYNPRSEIEGRELGALPGVVPSADDTKYVSGAQELEATAPLHKR